MKIRGYLAALATGIAVAVVPIGATAADAASACSATMTVTKPTQRSNTTVVVSKLRKGAAVTTQAKYKTTTTKKTGTADAKGVARIVYNIGGATKGRKVVVSVSARLGGSTWTCSTSFVPR